MLFECSLGMAFPNFEKKKFRVEVYLIRFQASNQRKQLVDSNWESGKGKSVKDSFLPNLALSIRTNINLELPTSNGYYQAPNSSGFQISRFLFRRTSIQTLDLNRLDPTRSDD